MEIIGTDMYDKKHDKKKTMVIISIAIVILLVISVILFAVISILKSKQFKFVVDSKRINSSSNDMFLFDNDDIYISLKDIAKLIGYEHFKGGYKQYDEDEDQCYLQCEDEITTFEKNSKKIYKTPTEEVDYTYFNLENEIIKENDKLYIELKDLGLACNLEIDYSEENNQVTVYTTSYLAEWYNSQYTNAAVNSFNNKKALLYGLLVVQNVDNTDEKVDEKTVRYGVNSLDNKEIVGMKYTNIEFIEGTQEFLVTTEEKKVGLISNDGTTKLKPLYDSLKQIDKDKNLYLASEDKLYGIIDRNGKKLLHSDFDQIGVDVNSFQSNNIKNKYILFNNVIPVKLNNKWGLYNTEGAIILPIEYDCLGCVSGTSTDSRNNVLIIPEIESIIVGKNYEDENKKKIILYGIYNSVGKEMVRVCLDSITKTSSSGQVEYTMIYNGQPFNVIEYVKEWVIPQQNVYTTPQEENNSNNKVNEVNVNSVNVNETVMVNDTVNSNIETNTITNNMVNQTLAY